MDPPLPSLEAVCFAPAHTGATFYLEVDMPRSTFARSGHSSPLGKIQPPLGQLRLHQVADERVRKAAAAAGKPVLEFVRDLVEVGFLGREELEHRQSIYLDRLESLLPKRNENSTRA